MFYLTRLILCPNIWARNKTQKNTRIIWGKENNNVSVNTVLLIYEMSFTQECRISRPCSSRSLCTCLKIKRNVFLIYYDSMLGQFHWNITYVTSATKRSTNPQESHSRVPQPEGTFKFFRSFGQQTNIRFKHLLQNDMFVFGGDSAEAMPWTHLSMHATDCPCVWDSKYLNEWTQHEERKQFSSTGGDSMRRLTEVIYRPM